jgi:hypothetical protein
MSLMMPPRFALTARKAGHLTLASNHGDATHLFVLEDDIIRVLVLPEGRLDQPRTFAVAPGIEDVALDGRDRFDLAGFTLPEFALEADTETSRLRPSGSPSVLRGCSVHGPSGLETSGDRLQMIGRPKPIISDGGTSASIITCAGSGARNTSVWGSVQATWTAPASAIA